MFSELFILNCPLLTHVIVYVLIPNDKSAIKLI